jgi:hypothetical protein
MSEVLPTDWSPNSTILVRFKGDDVKSAVVGVPELAIMIQRGCLGYLGCWLKKSMAAEVKSLSSHTTSERNGLPICTSVYNTLARYTNTELVETEIVARNQIS